MCQVSMSVSGMINMRITGMNTHRSHLILPHPVVATLSPSVFHCFDLQLPARRRSVPDDVKLVTLPAIVSTGRNMAS
jgi:hypothetical protein